MRPFWDKHNQRINFISWHTNSFIVLYTGKLSLSSKTTGSTDRTTTRSPLEDSTVSSTDSSSLNLRCPLWMIPRHLHCWDPAGKTWNQQRQRRIQDFPQIGEGAPTPSGANLLFCIVFAESCMKMKKMEAQLSPLLDPPLKTVKTRDYRLYILFCNMFSFHRKKLKFDTSSAMTSESSRDGDAAFAARRMLNKDAAKSVEFDSARNTVTSSLHFLFSIFFSHWQIYCHGSWLLWHYHSSRVISRQIKGQ